MRRFEFAVAVTAVAALVVLAGCRHPSRVEAHWAEAQHAASEQMVAHPEASSEEAYTGLEGTTAEQAIVNYRKQQAEKRTRRAAPSIINIGGGGS